MLWGRLTLCTKLASYPAVQQRVCFINFNIKQVKGAGVRWDAVSSTSCTSANSPLSGSVYSSWQSRKMRSSQDTPPVIESEFAALRLLIFPDIVTHSDELKDSHKLQQAYEFHLNELATNKAGLPRLNRPGLYLGHVVSLGGFCSTGLWVMKFGICLRGSAKHFLVRQTYMICRAVF